MSTKMASKMKKVIELARSVFIITSIVLIISFVFDFFDAVLRVFFINE